MIPFSSCTTLPFAPPSHPNDTSDNNNSISTEPSAMIASQCQPTVLDASLNNNTSIRHSNTASPFASSLGRLQQHQQHTISGDIPSREESTSHLHPPPPPPKFNTTPNRLFNMAFAHKNNNIKTYDTMFDALSFLDQISMLLPSSSSSSQLRVPALVQQNVHQQQVQNQDISNAFGIDTSVNIATTAPAIPHRNINTVDSIQVDHINQGQNPHFQPMNRQHFPPTTAPTVATTAPFFSNPHQNKEMYQNMAETPSPATDTDDLSQQNNSTSISDAELKKLKRRAVNRESARRLRRKRQETMEELQQRCKELNEENSKLLAFSALFERQKQVMVAQMAVLRQRFVTKVNENNALQQELEYLKKELEEYSDEEMKKVKMMIRRSESDCILKEKKESDECEDTMH